MFRLAQFRKRDKGNEQVPKYRTIPKFASESSSYSHATSEEELVTFHAEQSSHKAVTGKPMKKILADEMSKEAVAKKKSPSVIAKFIGLDGASSSKSRASKLSKKNSAEMDRIRNMFNYQEASNVADRRKSSKRSNYEEDLAFMRKKNDEIIREADEIRRKWRGKSNQEVIEKFLQQPDSLFIKHVLEHQGRHPSSHCSHIAIMRSTTSINYEANTKAWIEERETEERETSRKCEMDFYERQDHRLLELYGDRRTHASLRASKIRLEAKKEETVIPPRRIFVLKPSFEQTNNTNQSVSSPDDFQKEEFDETKILCRKCRKEIAAAKGITGKMRNSQRSGSVPPSGVKGYDREESLHMSDSDSEAVVTLTSRNFPSNWYNHDNPPYPRASDSSSVSREAKKRVSQRWKLTNGYIDVEGIGQGSTLGEMLSTPDRKMGINGRDGWKDGYLRTSQRSGSVPPSFGSRRHKSSEHLEFLEDERLLIHREAMSRDRSKVVKGHVSQRESKNLRSKVKKLHPSQPPHAFTKKSTDSVPTIISSQKLTDTNFEIDDRGKEKPLVPQTPDDISNATSIVNPTVKTNVIMPYDSLSVLVSPQLCAQNNFEIDDHAEEKPLLPLDGISSSASVVDAKVNTDIIMFSDASSELIPLLSACTLGDGNSSALHEDVPSLQGPSNGKPEGDSDALQFPKPELEGELEQESETSEVAKEAGHHSPVSTLEVPSTKDSSSGFDSLEKVNADIQELRIHLNQLKMDSDDQVASDKKVLVEEAEEEEVAFDEEGLVEYDYWEPMYIVDLLVESGLYGTDPGSFISNCYSPDSPLDPSLFDILEKKYFDEITGPKQVRKILYDHVNELLLEIYRSVMESYPWVKARVGFGLKWETGGVEEQLGNLLDFYQKEAQKKVLDTVLDKSDSWYQPREVVDEIGKKIQELLLDDLITEALNM